MSERVWIRPQRLDAEAEAIVWLLSECGESVALDWSHLSFPRAVGEILPPDGMEIYAIEREDWPDWAEKSARVHRINHHAPGDPGYGVPPVRFMPGSSLGQVIAELAELGLTPASWPSRDGFSDSACGELAYDGSWAVCVRSGCKDRSVSSMGDVAPDEESTWAVIPERLAMIAAADHCLGAAYAGQCPGVEPDALWRFRIAKKASFRGCPVDEIRADANRTGRALCDAPEIVLGFDPHCDLCNGRGHYYDANGDSSASGEPGEVACRCGLERTVLDMRRDPPWPELPEVAARRGEAFIAGPLIGPDGRRKIVLQCATPAQLEAWPAWAAANGIVDLYGGDPARGFAGGYLAPHTSPAEIAGEGISR